MAEKKISLTRAILFCINTVMGAGLFLNPKVLVGLAGPYCFVGYLVAAIILLPLLLSMAELTRFQPVSGGVYVYGRTYLNSGMGFLSAWSFFIAKTVSAIFILHSCVSFVQPRVAFLAGVPVLFLDYLAVALLIALNTSGVSVGGRIQYLFAVFKITPLVFAFVCGFTMFDTNMFVFDVPEFSSFLQIIPISLYAFVGFEVICSIGGLLHNPQKNIRRAMVGSFGIIVFICMMFTMVLYGVLGSQAATSHNALLMLGTKLGFPLFGRIANGIVFTSLIGGAFCMLMGNCWNLQTISEHGHFPFKRILTKVNRYQVPWVSLIIEGLIAVFVITITTSQVTLQNMSVFALFICYLITAFAAFKAVGYEVRSNLPRWVPVFAMVTCSSIIVLCLKNIYTFGVSFSFLSIFLFGCGLALWAQIQKKSMGRG